MECLPSDQVDLFKRALELKVKSLKEELKYETEFVEKTGLNSNRYVADIEDELRDTNKTLANFDKLPICKKEIL